jgi:hypothetical protein
LVKNMIDYNDITEVNEQLALSQEADVDNRDRAREAHNFLEKEDGQWEPEIIQKSAGRYRGTFDKCNPVVDGIVGEIVQADFDIRVRPAGGEATKGLAKTYDGLIRNIEAISNASGVYGSAAREMVASGLGGWEIATDWASPDSFDQDFVIRWITDYENRVWFDAGSLRQDASDARHVFILDSITPDEYKTRFPDGSGQSVGDDRSFETYEFKPDFITVGRVLYKEPVKKQLVLMSDGAVYERDAEFEKIEDELLEEGITVVREREKESFKVLSRLFDGGDFLTDPEETVFKELPIVPVYGNFAVREGKVVYHGAVLHLIDAQRAYNFARSRETEDIALSPPDVTWVSRTQISSPADKAALENMNTSAQRVYTFTPDPENPGPPIRSGGPQIAPGTQQAIQNAIGDIQTSAARAPIQGGNLDGPLSGVAIQALQNKGDTGTIKYFKSMELAICRTAKILVESLPDLYDTATQKRILNEDDSFEMIEINKRQIDLETGEEVVLHDLRQGKYDVTCDVGPAFKNRQQETVKALTELSQTVPGIGELSADIQLKNIATPGVDLVAERVRKQLVNSGVIPESQLTEEEINEVRQAQALAQQQPKEVSAEDKIAEAEIARVQAETQDVIARAQLKQEELRIKEQKDLLDAQNKAEKLSIEELLLSMKQQQNQIANQQALLEASAKGQAQVFETLNTQADTLKKLKDAMGIDTIVGPSNMEAYKQQAEFITEQQEEINDL